MKHLISISESVGRRETSHGTCEVCATADASYDEATQRIAIKLEKIKGQVIY